MGTEPKRFKRACRRGEFAKADYILRAWRMRLSDRRVDLWLSTGGWWFR